MLTALFVIAPGGARQAVALSTLRTPELQERARADANTWVKSLRLVSYEGRTMRERFTFRDDSLWWFTEIYLHKMRRLDDAVETVRILDAAVSALAPARLAVSCSSRASAAAARAFAQARGLPIDIEETVQTPRRRVDLGLLVGVSAWLSRLRPAPLPPAGPVRIAAFVHTAFWKPDPAGTGGRESYVGDVLNVVAARVAPADLRLVGVGPRRTFRTRRWWDPVLPGSPRVVTPVEQFAPRSALRESLSLWRNRDALATAATQGDGIRDAARYDGCDLWPILSAELADAARIQWTWSARAMDEARAALLRLEPDVVVTYAEAGGWGRALILEARRLGIPTVALQHGFIYRHWLNYRHEADELQPAGSDAGFPLPTRTLVFDRYAQTTLELMGHVPSDALRVTGSPRLDEFAARIKALRSSTQTVRDSLGVAPDDHLLVLAAKASELGAHLDALFAAVSRDQLRLVVKPHPAESREVYLKRVPANAPIDVLAPHADLGRLLAAADGLVTMNSTVAVDALALGIPTLVIGLPNNLSPFVDAGAMLGAVDADIPTAINTLLYDREARKALLERGRTFAQTYGMQASGQAATRAAECILLESRATERNPVGPGGGRRT